jgi:hypothetical protein
VSFLNFSAFTNYGDWAEYQYNLVNDKWYYRNLSGSYPASVVNAEKFKKLTIKATKAS